jgi:hypothetical protein
MLICRNESVVSKTDDQYFNPPNVNFTDLYNAMIHPLTRMVIYGAIWYQGRTMRYKLSSPSFFVQLNQIVAIIEINIHVHLQK